MMRLQKRRQQSGAKADRALVSHDRHHRQHCSPAECDYEGHHGQTIDTRFETKGLPMILKAIEPSSQKRERGAAEKHGTSGETVGNLVWSFRTGSVDFSLRV